MLKKCHLKIFRYFSSDGPFCLEERTVSAILEDGIARHISEIILNFDKWCRRCHLKIFLFLASVAIVFSGTK